MIGLAQLRVLIIISLRLMFRRGGFHHENTKLKKHKIYTIFFRVFIFSCFRD
jgi:hypothetical protein